MPQRRCPSKGDNGCNYGACKSLASGTLNCAYDRPFCGSTEEWLTAAEVIGPEKKCTCMNILNYPMNIGTCSSSGVYSPMAVAGHCNGGTAVCDADASGHYFLGDTAAGATQFTACDLKCDGTATRPSWRWTTPLLERPSLRGSRTRRQPRRRRPHFDVGDFGVTDMSYLFCADTDSSSVLCTTAAASFNQDIGAWDTSSVHVDELHVRRLGLLLVCLGL